MLFGRSPSSRIRMGSPQGEQPREISRRRIVKLALSAAALAAVLDKTSSQARAEARVIRIGFQKYGTLILLKGKGLAEKALRDMAQISGGRFYREEDLHQLVGAITPRATSFTSRQEIILWNPLVLRLISRSVHRHELWLNRAGERRRRDVVSPAPG